MVMSWYCLQCARLITAPRKWHELILLTSFMRLLLSTGCVCISDLIASIAVMASVSLS